MTVIMDYIYTFTFGYYETRFLTVDAFIIAKSFFFSLTLERREGAHLTESAKVTYDF